VNVADRVTLWNDYRSRIDLFLSDDEAEQGRLAVPVPSDKPEPFPAVQLESGLREQLLVAVALRYVVDYYHFYPARNNPMPISMEYTANAPAVQRPDFPLNKTGVWLYL
jgi:hypothetical protein